MSTPRAQWLFCAVVTMLLLYGPLDAGGLTTDPDARTIADALKWGEQGDPQPYRLQAGKGVVVGYVYTPFVRIAMAARSAKAKGETLDVSRLPNWLTEPLVYFALRWYCAGDECSDQNFEPLSGPHRQS